MPPSSPTLPGRKAEPHSVTFTLGAIMLVVGMTGLAAAYGLSALIEHHRPAAGLNTASPLVARTLVGKQLSIPAAWLRDTGQKTEGFSSRIDLELSPPLGRNGAAAPIEVTLLPLSQVRPSARLLDGVYLHQFMPNELSGPPGLVGKPLYGTEGYQNETVWYDALSQEPFVAKCMAPATDEGQPRCLRTVALADGIAAVYSFDADVLNSWQQFDPVMRTWLGRIGAL